MAEAADKILLHASDRTRADLDRDELFALAILRLIEIVGEAASQVTNTTRQRFPHVNWQDAADMRNRIIHQYFDVDMDRVWTTVTLDIPNLATELKRVLAAFDNE